MVLREWQTYLATICLFWTWPLHGHEGPPYPIIVDWQSEGIKSTVWADPDVGIGTFYITLEGDLQGIDPITFDISVYPMSDAAREQRYPFTRADGAGLTKFEAQVPFPTREDWHIEVIAQIGSTSDSAETVVAVTPPGLGSSLDIAWYMLPFVGFGTLWVLAAFRPK